MARKRRTWAAEGPALPGYGVEDTGHPAYMEDPDAEDYVNGNPSSWAEDVNTDVLAPGGAPAMPTETLDHPAKRASQIRVAAERKASKCVRIAEALLGRNVSASIVEDQAVAFMDMSEAQVDDTLERLSGGFLAMEDDDDDMLAELFDDDDDDDDGMLAALFEDDEDEEDDLSEEDEMLAEMLRDDGALAEDTSEEDAMLAEMLSDAEGRLAEEDPEETSEKQADAGDRLAAMEAKIAELTAMLADKSACGGDCSDAGDQVVDFSIGEDEDPMDALDMEEDSALSMLFASEESDGSDSEEADGSDSKEDAAKEDGGKKASRKPKIPRTASAIPSLGFQPGSSNSEIQELTALWGTAPDVSDSF